MEIELCAHFIDTILDSIVSTIRRDDPFDHLH
jgi:hypothetical protein